MVKPQPQKMLPKERNSKMSVGKVKYLEWNCEERLWVCENETGDNHTDIHHLSWVALLVAKTVPFCTFHAHIPKISSNTRFPGILEMKSGVFKPEESKAHFIIILNGACLG